MTIITFPLSSCFWTKQNNFHPYCGFLITVRHCVLPQKCTRPHQWTTPEVRHDSLFTACFCLSSAHPWSVPFPPPAMGLRQPWREEQRCQWKSRREHLESIGLDLVSQFEWIKKNLIHISTFIAVEVLLNLYTRSLVDFKIICEKKYKGSDLFFLIHCRLLRFYFSSFPN